MSISTSVSGFAVTPGTRAISAPDRNSAAHGRAATTCRFESSRLASAGQTARSSSRSSAPRPPEAPSLVIGHEVLGQVEARAKTSSAFRRGDLVTATVRRPCGCPQCAAGASDFCAELRYTERGIIGLHGFMTHRFVESAEHIIPVPADLKEIGVLIEPTSVAEKAWRVASGVQARIAGWRPRTAVVFGAGPIGLLTTLVLRAKNMDVYTIARRPASESARGGDRRRLWRDLSVESRAGHHLDQAAIAQRGSDRRMLRLDGGRRIRHPAPRHQRRAGPAECDWRVPQRNPAARQDQLRLRDRQ